MKPRWQIADLLDLHYFFKADEARRDQGDEETAARRDRVLYLTKIQPELDGEAEVPPRVLARRWLTVRRLQHSREQGGAETVLPGAACCPCPAPPAGLGSFLAALSAPMSVSSSIK